MEKPPPEEAKLDLGWWEPRNVLYEPWPGEGAVVQSRVSGGRKGAALTPTTWVPISVGSAPNRL